jgi:hypothetical protein
VIFLQWDGRARGDDGAISAPLAALIIGVLKAMFLNKLKTVLVVVLVLSLTGAGAGVLTHQVLAQKRPPEEGKEKPSFKVNTEETSELNGRVQSVDTMKNTLTLISKGIGNHTYDVAKETKVYLEDGTGGRLGFKEGRLNDLGEGMSVTLRLSADRKTIVGVWAEGMTVRGPLKALDAGKNTITVGIQIRKGDPTDKTFEVSRDAGVFIHDGRPKDKGTTPAASKLADLPVGAILTLRLSADQKSVGNIQAEGPDVQGVVKAVAVDMNTITVNVNDGQQEVEKTFNILPTTYIGVGAGRGKGKTGASESKLADVPVGAHISMKLSLDQKTVLSLSAEGSGFSGAVKGVDAGKNTITLLIFAKVKKGDPGEEKTFAVAKDVVLLIDGKDAKLAELPVESVASIKLSPDQKTVINIQADGPGVSGIVKAVDVDKGAITLANKNGEQTYTVGKTTRIVIDGKDGKLADVPLEAVIGKSRLSADQKTVLLLAAEGSSFSGVLKAVDVEKRKITVTVAVKKGETEDKVFEVAKDAEVATGINGVPLKLADLKGDKPVVLQMAADHKTVRRITVSGE